MRLAATRGTRPRLPPPRRSTHWSASTLLVLGVTRIRQIGYLEVVSTPPPLSRLAYVLSTMRPRPLSPEVSAAADELTALHAACGNNVVVCALAVHRHNTAGGQFG